MNFGPETKKQVRKGEVPKIFTATENKNSTLILCWGGNKQTF